jgi:uroporphyrinogen-III synthase
MRVLVTRPEPGAGRTAAALRNGGYQPVVVPLTGIEPLQPDVPGGSFDIVVASSANAVRHAPAAVVGALARLPFFAVGDETAAAARAAGFAIIRSSAGTAADLVRDVAASARPGARLAYLSGRVRLDTVEAELSRLGLAVVPVETYDTPLRVVSPGDAALIGAAPIDVALVYSARAADALGRLVKSSKGTIFGSTVFIAISPRVAEQLAGTGGHVLTADRPNEDAMFDVLSRLGHEPAAFGIRSGSSA